MLVVADTSSINYLVLMPQETLLPILYERVVIPPTVHEELQRCWPVMRPAGLARSRIGVDGAAPLRPPVAAYRTRLTPLNGPTAGRYTARRLGAVLLRLPAY
jgi:hypothetical protein